MMRALVYCMVLFLLASSVSGFPPIPQHNLYGYVTDATGWGIVGANVVVTGNESGVVLEEVSGVGGYFSSGFMSDVSEGELLVSESCWLGECANVSRRALGARSLFELEVPVVVDRPRHRRLVRNVSVRISGDSVRLGELTNVSILVVNIGDLRQVGIKVVLEGIPSSWNVSRVGDGLLDLDPSEEGVVVFMVGVPLSASVGDVDLSVSVEFDTGIVVVPFEFGVLPFCLDDSECGSGFMCVGGVCEVDRRCFNGVRDHGESGVDCGGPCGECTVTTVPRPRLTTLPSITTLPKSTTVSGLGLGSCFNGILDVGEVGVDCGGSCPPCVSGRSLWGWFGGIAVFILLVLILLIVLILWLKKRYD